MPVSRDVVAKRVKKVIRENCPRDDIRSGATPLEEDHWFYADLDMTKDIREGLAEPYSDISRSYGGKLIGGSEARDRRKVKAAIDLVHARANDGGKQ